MEPTFLGSGEIRIEGTALRSVGGQECADKNPEALRNFFDSKRNPDYDANHPMNETALPNRRRMRSRRLFGIAIPAVIVLVGFGLWLRSNFTFVYPYGSSHSCSKQLGLGLRMYANDHGGWLPHGGRTPEESLSLACADGDPIILKHLMRGKHVPQAAVDAAFAKDGVLSPDTCGWHYVEGLREGDNPQIAVAWDKKVGLNHNGRLLKGLQCVVVLLDGSSQQISKTDWPTFCAEQQKLLEEAVAGRGPNDPPIRWSDEQALGSNWFAPRLVGTFPSDGIYRIVYGGTSNLLVFVKPPDRGEAVGFAVEPFAEFSPRGVAIFQTPTLHVLQIDGACPMANWSDEEMVVVVNRKPYLQVRKSRRGVGADGRPVGAEAILTLQFSNRVEAEAVASAMRKRYSLP